MKKNSRICVLGDDGLLGTAVCKLLSSKGFNNVFGCHYPDVDLTIESDVNAFFERTKPEYVFFFAAVAAGINYKKNHPAEMLLNNVKIIINVLSASKEYKCKKILNVSSALIYSELAPIPYTEESIGYVNINSIDAPYTLAKSIGLALASYFSNSGTNVITAIPCNFFGENAPFDNDRASVVSALIKRMVEAKYSGLNQVEIWGTGNARRDLLNSKDVANACLLLMCEEKATGLYNIGRGVEYSIKEVAETIKKVVGFSGDLVFNSTKPEGKQHMLMDITKIQSLGWKPSLDLESSIADAYEWYMSNVFNR